MFPEPRPAMGGEQAKRRRGSREDVPSGEPFNLNPVEEEYRQGLGQADEEYSRCHPHVIPSGGVGGGFQLILSTIESVGGVVVPVKDGCVGSRLGNVCSLDFRRMVFR